MKKIGLWLLGIILATQSLLMSTLGVMVFLSYSHHERAISLLIHNINNLF